VPCTHRAQKEIIQCPLFECSCAILLSLPSSLLSGSRTFKLVDEATGCDVEHTDGTVHGTAGNLIALVTALSESDAWST